MSGRAKIAGEVLWTTNPQTKPQATGGGWVTNDKGNK